MNKKSEYEVIIVGCGIAGASLAYFLSKRGLTDVLILEREEQPGYHSTGRSAAVLIELGMIPSVLQLTLLAADFLRDPPEGFYGAVADGVTVNTRAFAKALSSNSPGSC